MFPEHTYSTRYWTDGEMYFTLLICVLLVTPWNRMLYTFWFSKSNVCFLHELIRFVFFPQVIGTLRATDKDDQLASFTFSLASDNSNFSLRDYGSKSLYSRSIFTFFPLCVCCSKRCSHKALFLPLVAMRQLKPHLRLGALLPKVEIILTLQSKPRRGI